MKRPPFTEKQLAAVRRNQKRTHGPACLIRTKSRGWARPAPVGRLRSLESDGLHHNSQTRPPEPGGGNVGQVVSPAKRFCILGLPVAKGHQYLIYKHGAGATIKMCGCGRGLAVSALAARTPRTKNADGGQAVKENQKAKGKWQKAKSKNGISRPRHEPRPTRRAEECLRRTVHPGKAGLIDCTRSGLPVALPAPKKEILGSLPRYI
jgi:hypothetical protein